MCSALVSAFESVRPGKYGWQPRDARAVTQILALSGGDEAEAVARFKRGLGETYKARCDSIFDLAQKWNALAGAGPAGKRTMSDVGEWNDPVKARETL